MAQPVTIEPLTSGRITLKTTAGDIHIDLWAKEAPKACRNVIQLALEGYYEGCEFHRIVPGLCVQTGDATNSGEGGESIYEDFYFDDEFSQRLRFNRRGLVAMANTGKRNTNLSQFFITLDKADSLQNKHTIFGTVRGDTYFNVVKISEGELQPDSERPLFPFVVRSVEVDDNPFPDIVPRITAEEKRAQEKARREARKNNAARGKKKQGVKNKSLVSFGDEEGEAETSASNVKIGSAHDALQNDPTLSREVKDVRGLPPDMPEGFGAAPVASGSSLPKGKRKADELYTDDRQRSRSKSAYDPMMDSSAYATRIEREEESRPSASVGDSKTRKKETKNGGEAVTESDRVKAEIAKVQADLRKLTRRSGADSGDESATTDGKGKKKFSSGESGAALLAAERAKYQKGGRAIGKAGGSTATDPSARGGKRKQGEDEDVMDLLEGFRGRVRAAATADPTSADGNGDSAKAEEPIDGYAGEILEEEIGDDLGWMAHTLKFRKDATNDIHRASEYEVIDPRSQNMTLEDAKRHEMRLKRQNETRGGRASGKDMARAEREVRSRDGGGGGRNWARDAERTSGNRDRGGQRDRY